MYCVIQKYVSNLCQSSVFQPYVCVYQDRVQRCVSVLVFKDTTCQDVLCHPKVCQQFVSEYRFSTTRVCQDGVIQEYVGVVSAMYPPMIYLLDIQQIRTC